MMLARVKVLACVIVLTRGMVLTLTRDGQVDAGICSSCGLCAYHECADADQDENLIHIIHV